MIRLWAKIGSWISLAALIAPALLFLTGRMALDRVKLVMLIATIIWFILAPLWMWNNDAKTQESKL